MLEASGLIESGGADREITERPKSDGIRPLLQVLDGRTDRVGASNGV